MDKQLLDLYSDYLLSSFSVTTATGLSSLVDGEVSHDKVTRFLSREDFGSRDFLGQSLFPKDTVIVAMIDGELPSYLESNSKSMRDLQQTTSPIVCCTHGVVIVIKNNGNGTFLNQ